MDVVVSCNGWIGLDPENMIFSGKPKDTQSQDMPNQA